MSETLNEYVIPQTSLTPCLDRQCYYLSILGIVEPPLRHVCQSLSYLRRMSNHTDLTPQELSDTIKYRLPIKDCPELNNPLFQPLLPYLEPV